MVLFRSSYNVLPGIIILTSLSFAAEDPLPLSHLQATRDDPIYTLYSAPLQRSTYLVDESYRLTFEDPTRPLTWIGSRSGSMSFCWAEGKQQGCAISDYVASPLIEESYADSGRIEFEPVKDVRVEHSFSVYSSRFLILDFLLVNHAQKRRTLELRLELAHPHGLKNLDVPGARDQVFFSHQQPPDRAQRSADYLPMRHNLLLSRPGFESHLLGMGVGRRGGRRSRAAGSVELKYALTLPASGRSQLRLIRAVDSASPIRLWAEAESLMVAASLKQILEESRSLYQKIQAPAGLADRHRLVFWQSFSLLQQLLMPAEGESSFNYYLTARPPDHLSERAAQDSISSLAMLGYVHMAPDRALDSQRVFFEREQPDGYIPHEVGPYWEDELRVKRQRTLPVPLLSWISWELYRSTQDDGFLEEAYDTASNHLHYWLAHRDRDGDGLYEWGGNGGRESGRSDAALWKQLGKDGASKVEAFDLNSMLVKEMTALAEMANALGESAEADGWRNRADRLAAKINEVFWDESSGYYYHVDFRENGFTTAKGLDLRQREAIGMLPLWAGVVPKERQQRLVAHLKQFTPDAAASGQLPWMYLVFRGLLDNGFREEAEWLANECLDGATRRLTKTHLFWESGGAEGSGSSARGAAIWSGLLARMVLDLNGKINRQTEEYEKP